jgi:hypothetical protein
VVAATIVAADAPKLPMTPQPDAADFCSAENDSPVFDAAEQSVLVAADLVRLTTIDANRGPSSFRKNRSKIRLCEVNRNHASVRLPGRFLCSGCRTPLIFRRWLTVYATAGYSYCLPDHLIPSP